MRGERCRCGVSPGAIFAEEFVVTRELTVCKRLYSGCKSPPAPAGIRSCRFPDTAPGGPLRTQLPVPPNFNGPYFLNDGSFPCRYADAYYLASAPIGSQAGSTIGSASRAACKSAGSALLRAAISKTYWPNQESFIVKKPSFPRS